MATQRKVTLQKGNTQYPGELLIGQSSIQLTSGIVALHREGHAYFHILKAIRSDLQKEGILLLVNGSRIDVYPSGMSLATYKAYIHTIGRQGTLDDLIDIFDPVSDTSKIASVEAQEDYHQRWIESLG